MEAVWADFVPIAVLLGGLYGTISSLGKYFRGPSPDPRDQLGWKLEVLGALAVGVTSIVLVGWFFLDSKGPVLGLAYVLVPCGVAAVGVLFVVRQTLRDLAMPWEVLRTPPNTNPTTYLFGFIPRKSVEKKPEAQDPNQE